MRTPASSSTACLMPNGRRDTNRKRRLRRCGYSKRRKIKSDPRSFACNHEGWLSELILRMSAANKVRDRLCLSALFCPLALYVGPLWGKVVSLDIEVREHVLGGGRHFGDAGPYELLAGRVHFAFDPKDPADNRVTDLDKAPVNHTGHV